MMGIMPIMNVPERIGRATRARAESTETQAVVSLRARLGIAARPVQRCSMTCGKEPIDRRFGFVSPSFWHGILASTQPGRRLRHEP